MSTLPEFKALRNSDSQPCAPFDFTPIRVVIVDPYNREIRQTRMARGLFALDAVDGGCLQFGAKITRTKEFHTETGGKWPHCFLIRGINVYFGLGFVTGGRDAQGRLRSSRISVAELLSFVRFPDSLTRETEGTG